MKKLFLSLLGMLFALSSVNAQNNITYDFENDDMTNIAKFGTGAIIDEITRFEIADNPVAGGINTSGKIFKFAVSAMRWGGLKIKFDRSYTLEEFEDFSTAKIKLYQPATADPASVVQKIRIKILGSWGGVNDNTPDPDWDNFDPGSSENGQEFAFIGSDEDGKSPLNYTVGEWFELTYDISTLPADMFPAGKVYGIAVEPTNGAAGNTMDGNGYLCYIDDITVVNKNATGISEKTADKYDMYISGNNLILNTTQTGKTDIVVFNVLGQKISQVYSGTITEGSHTFPLSLNNGIYLIKSEIDGTTSSIKTIIK